MKAMMIEAFGEPGVFKLAEAPKPEPKAGEVVVAVRASSVNPVDYKIRDGRAARLCPGFPAVLHTDCAGVVAAVGAGVTTLEEAGKVFAFANGMGGKPDALAEFMAVDARMAARKRELAGGNESPPRLAVPLPAVPGLALAAGRRIARSQRRDAGPARAPAGRTHAFPARRSQRGWPLWLRPCVPSPAHIA